MANSKTLSEGGSGGKRGHSAMEHWMPTAEVKNNANKRRREENKISIGEEDFPDIPSDFGITHQ
jgi:hypothetical protein